MLVAPGSGPALVQVSAAEPGREPCTTLPRLDRLRAGPSASPALIGIGGGGPAGFAVALGPGLVSPPSLLDSSQNLRVSELVGLLGDGALFFAAGLLESAPRPRLGGIARHYRESPAADTNQSCCEPSAGRLMVADFLSCYATHYG